VQLEFGFLLGPADGRYLLRRSRDAEPERVLVLATLGAPQRRLLAGRRGRRVEEAEPEPVPTSRATVVRAQPFESAGEAEAWLTGLREDWEAAKSEVDGAVRDLNGAIRGYRVAAADPHARDIDDGQALVVRVGYGVGDEVADGRFSDAWELPRERTRTRRSMEAPEERFAALLGGRQRSLACEELVLRARADLDAGRPREAALQARIALEAVLAELPSEELDGDRAAIGDAANAALRGDPAPELQEAVAATIARMEASLRRMRLKG
jgi:hypothetical protein